jgi:hypothetical protein
MRINGSRWVCVLVACGLAWTTTSRAAESEFSARVLGVPVELAPLTAVVAAHGEHLRAALAPSAVAKVQKAAIGLVDEGFEEGVTILSASQRSGAALLGADARPGDVNAVAFLVLFEAAAGMDSDLRSVLAEAKSMAEAKQTLRDDQIALAKALARHRAQAPLPAVSDSPVPKLVRQRSPLLHLEYVHAPALPELPSDLAKAPTSDLKRLWLETEGLSAVPELAEITTLRLQAARARRDRYVAVLSELEKQVLPTAEVVVHRLQ